VDTFDKRTSEKFESNDDEIELNTPENSFVGLEALYCYYISYTCLSSVCLLVNGME